MRCFVTENLKPIFLFFNGCGKHQALYKALSKTVPVEGSSNTMIVEVLRLWNNWVYRVYNDGEDDYWSNCRTRDLVTAYKDKALLAFVKQCPPMDKFFARAVEYSKQPNPYDAIYEYGDEVTVTVRPAWTDKELDDIMDAYLEFVQSHLTT